MSLLDHVLEWLHLAQEVKEICDLPPPGTPEFRQEISRKIPHYIMKNNMQQRQMQQLLKGQFPQAPLNRSFPQLSVQNQQFIQMIKNNFKC